MPAFDPNEDTADFAPQTNAQTPNPVSDIADVEVLSSGHVLLRATEAAAKDSVANSPLVRLIGDVGDHPVIVDIGSITLMPDILRGKLLVQQSKLESDSCLITTSPQVMDTNRLNRFDNTVPCEQSLQGALARLGIEGATVDQESTLQLYSKLADAKESRKRAETTSSWTTTPVNLRPTGDENVSLIVVTGRITPTDEGSSLSEQVVKLSEGRSIILDVSQSLDASAEGVGDLLRVFKHCQTNAQSLTIVDTSADQRASRNMRQMLKSVIEFRDTLP
jgi:hypothetical protein